MIDIKDKVNCCGCSACEQVCPIHCIRLCSDDEGFLYPVTDKNVCIECGLCVQVCPILNAKDEVSSLLETYAAYNKNEDQRLSSSSGGVFSLLAEQILKKNGIVFGAAFSEDFRSVKHTVCESTDGIVELRGSKYLQSDKQASYAMVHEALQDDTLVLFSGTPCEIEGLKSYLRKPYKNLICVDIICHGVPSPILWSKYVSFREKEAGASVLNVSFRHKYYGWKKFSVLFEFLNGTEYLSPLNKDPYMQMFLQDLCLRPSCYDCRFKKKNRESDITLADFWGCDRVVPDMDDDKGLSLIILHSERGKRLLDSIRGDLEIKPVGFEAATIYNSAMSLSVKKPESRDAFMKEMTLLEILALAERYLRKPSFKDKVISLMKSIFPHRLQVKIKKMIY